MKENETEQPQNLNEISDHITALGTWANAAPGRVAFIVVGTCGAGRIETHNSLMGSGAAIARTLYSNTCQDKDFAEVLDLYTQMKQNPALATMFDIISAHDANSPADPDEKGDKE